MWIVKLGSLRFLDGTIPRPDCFCSRSKMLRLSVCSSLVAIMAGVTSGCGTSATSVRPPVILVDESISAVSQNERIRFVVLHYTALINRDSVDTLSQGAVSSHYLVLNPMPTRNGMPVVLGLVPEEKRAWHAGWSRWHGRSNLNDTSIGIELVNLGYRELPGGGKQWFRYDPGQISALIELLHDVCARYGIAPEDVVGHADVAPMRKEDPGPLFPWEALARSGIGAWPEKVRVMSALDGRDPDALMPVGLVQKEISRYGYDDMPSTGVDDEVTRRVISAFQMHFRQRNYSGRPDAETWAIARALNEQYGR